MIVTACLFTKNQFGTANSISIEEVAKVFAHAGVTIFEAEEWCAWAATYVDMIIEEQPNEYYIPEIRQVRQMAIMCITQDPLLVLRTLHLAASGNYCLRPVKTSVLLGTCVNTAAAPIDAEAGLSMMDENCNNMPNSHPDATPIIHDVNDDDQVSLFYDSDLDGELKISPD
jgi:hypothetical protein